MKIKKGDAVKIKPEYQDDGDEVIQWVAIEESGMVRAVLGDVVAGHPIKKMMGVYQWFEWNGRAFNLPVMCRVLGEPVLEVSEYKRDAVAMRLKVAGLFGAGIDQAWMIDLLNQHDRIFEKQMEEMRNGC